MAFGKPKKTQPCRVYQYGASERVTRGGLPGEHLAVHQMRARNTYWNRLVEKEHQHREQRESIVREYAPDPEDKAARKAAWKLPELLERIGALEAERTRQAKAARAGLDLYWCNYDDVEAAYRAARQRPGDLQFHPWARETGKVSVRFQQGLPVAAAFGSNTRLRIDPIDAGAAWGPGPQRARKRAQETTVHFRVGSGAARQPIWLSLPVTMHRPLPSGGVIRSAAVLRERIATHWRWKIAFTVELPEAAPLRSSADGRAIAIDLGWRVRPNGVRVGYWVDAANDQGEILVPDTIVRQMEKAAAIESDRDRYFNLVRDALTAWLAEHRALLPEWLASATETISQWRSQSRLAALALAWRDQRFDGDAETFTALEHWRRRDKHLYEYSENMGHQLRGRRLYEYRQFASWVARHYSRLVIEDFDLRDMAEVADGTAGKELPEKARWYRHVLAPSTFRLALINACKREGVIIEKLPAANTTRTCYNCGTPVREDWDAAKELRYRCEQCGTEWDQDENAARNLLRWSSGGQP